MKNNFFTHKFLPIVGVFLLVAFSLCTSCFASFDFTYNETSYSLPDYDYILNNVKNEYGYNDISYVIGYGSINSTLGSRFKLYIFTSDVSSYSNVFLKDSGGSEHFVNLYTKDSNNEDSCINGSNGLLYYYDQSSNSWVQWSSFNGSTNASYRFPYFDLIYSTHDVFDSSSNLVFQGAPQVEEVPKVELMKATQVEEIPQQIVTIVMIVLPIFLAIFGVLLVLYLIKSKNLLQL